MEKIVKKLFIFGTLAVGVAVSATALGYTNAVSVTRDHAEGTCDQTVTYTVKVPKTLILQDTITNVNIENAKVDEVNTGNIAAHVLANIAYQAQLSATQPNLVANSDNITRNIAAITSGQSLAAASLAGNDLWGFLKDGNYVSILDHPTWQFPRSAANVTATGDEISFGVGIGVSPTLPTGTYSTEVTLTLSTDLTN